MLSSLLGSAAVVGFFGSAHCAMMCGPLAIAGCTARRNGRPRAFAAYLAGRLISYAFGGALFGQLGLSVARALPLAPLQRGLLLAVSGAALVRGLRVLATARLSRPPLPVRPPVRPGGATAFLAGFMPRRGLGLGLATGALPCGMLAGGWTIAAASGSPASGALVMVAFCLASTPALILSVMATGPVRRLAASPLVAGLAWCALGLWLGVRPLLEQLGHCH